LEEKWWTAWRTNMKWVEKMEKIVNKRKKRKIVSTKLWLWILMSNNWNEIKCWKFESLRGCHSLWLHKLNGRILEYQAKGQNQSKAKILRPKF
jgi:hypothetical protein